MEERAASFYKSPECVKDIDRSLTYIKTLHDPSSSRGVFLVEDAGELRVLKVAGPNNRRIEGHLTEQDALEKLQRIGAVGFPEIYETFNGGETYESSEPSGTLVEYIAGKPFNISARNPLVHSRVKPIIRGLHTVGLSLPNDFIKNLQVKDNEPYLLDLEECRDLTRGARISDYTSRRKELLYSNWFDQD